MEGIKISIHALREEGDVAKCYAWVGESKFLSTPSVRRATRPSLRIRHTACISIHALREEGDAVEKPAVEQAENFYPRPP